MTTVEELDKRVTVLEEQVKAVTYVAGEAHRRFKITAEYVGYIELEMKAMRSEISDLRDRMTALEQRVSRVEERLTNVEERLTSVEERLARVEERQIGHEVILNSHGEMLREILRRLPPAA